MGFLDDVWDAVVGVVTFVTNDIPTAVGILTQAAAQMGMTLEAFIQDITTTVQMKLLRPLLPDDVAKVVTLMTFLLHTSANYGLNWLHNLGVALQTKELGDIFDFVTPAVTAAMTTARNDAARSAKGFPVEILDLIPIGDRGQVSDARWTTISRMEDRMFPTVWSFFSAKKQAICLFDIVVYFEDPEFNATEGKFTAVHELKHVMQFRAMGQANFIQDYLADYAKGLGLNTRLEVEADGYACSAVPDGTPRYGEPCKKPCFKCKGTGRFHAFHGPDDTYPACDHWKKCSGCDGTGKIDGKVQPCATCSGAGEIHRFLGADPSCPNCNHWASCVRCDGKGISQK